MSKFIALFLLMTISSYSYGIEDYSTIFNKSFSGKEKLASYYNEFNNGTIIIYAGENGYVNSINNISNLWISSNGIKPKILKKALIKLSKNHVRLNGKISLTAQNVYVEKMNKVFCIIHDPKSYVTNPHSEEEKILALHEIEHCYMNGITSPIFSYDEINIHIDENLPLKKRKEVHRLYNYYIQEIFSDISALNNSKFDHQETLINLRENLLSKGDFFHDSRIFIDKIKKTYDNYPSKTIKRNDILKFLSLNSFDIMPISLFITIINDPDIIKP
jgi:hypothetical protein